MMELTKRERKVLVNFIGFGSYVTLEQHRGRFYWGGDFQGACAVNIGPVYDSLLKKGFIEYVHGSVPRYGGFYRRTNKYQEFICSNNINGHRCQEGKIYTPTSDLDEYTHTKCSVCDGTGLNLKAASAGEGEK